MYQQPNHSYSSSDSLRRLSSNNPFRQYQPSPAPVQPQSSLLLLQLPQHGLGYQNTNNSHNSILAKHYAHSPRKASTLSNQSTSSAHFDEWVAKTGSLLMVVMTKNFMVNQKPIHRSALTKSLVIIKITTHHLTAILVDMEKQLKDIVESIVGVVPMAKDLNTLATLMNIRATVIHDPSNHKL